VPASYAFQSLWNDTFTSRIRDESEEALTEMAERINDCLIGGKEIDPEKAATRQMTCVSGRVRVTSKKGGKTLKTGQSAVVSPKEVAEINNSGKENAWIVQVLLDDDAG